METDLREWASAVFVGEAGVPIRVSRTKDFSEVFGGLRICKPFESVFDGTATNDKIRVPFGESSGVDDVGLVSDGFLVDVGFTRKVRTDAETVHGTTEQRLQRPDVTVL